MSYNELKNKIISQDLCTSCGLCVAVCPNKLLIMSDKLIPVPVCKSTNGIVDRSCLKCGLCEKVCGGYDSQTSISERSLYGRNRTIEERWTGIYKAAYQLTTKDLNILRRSSSGGAGTVFAMTALKEGIVDAMLVVGREREHPWISKALFVDSPEKVVEYAQTTYCITPNLHILSDSPYERIGIIGLPCQMQGLRKLINIKNNPQIEKLSRKVVLLIELACSSNTTIEGTEHIIEYLLKIPLNNVAELRYREGKYPGNFMVKTKDGKKHNYPFFKMVEEFKKFKTFRCNACPDWWSGLADISIADGDPNIYALSRDEHKSPPSSTIVIRTPLGQRVVDLAHRRGLISLYKYCFDNNLGLERKRQRYRFYASTSCRRIPLPPGEDCFYEDIISDEEVLNCGINIESYAVSKNTAQ